MRVAFGVPWHTRLNSTIVPSLPRARCWEGAIVTVALVALDFDNVLIEGSHHLFLAKQVGRAEQMQDLFDAARHGGMPVEGFVRRAARLLAGLPVTALRQTGASLPLTPGASELASALRDHGISVIVISHGIYQVVKAATKPLGVAGVFASRALESNGVLTGQVDGAILTSTDKLMVLRREAIRRGVSMERCAAVGDGANDYDMLAGVGLPIGFNPVEALRAIQGIHIVTSDQLHSVIHVIVDSMSL